MMIIIIIILFLMSHTQCGFQLRISSCYTYDRDFFVNLRFSRKVGVTDNVRSHIQQSVCQELSKYLGWQIMIFFLFGDSAVNMKIFEKPKRLVPSQVCYVCLIVECVVQVRFRCWIIF